MTLAWPGRIKTILSRSMPSTRGYNEKEIGALIQRATELHESSSGTASDESKNLSLDEIEQIASELGLPSVHLRTAAAELENRKNSESDFSFWGTPFVVSESRVVDGDLSDEQWEDLVYELRRNVGRTGQVTDEGQLRQWTHTVGEDAEGIKITKTSATARSRKGRTTIEIRKQFGIVGALYPLAFFFSVIGALAVTNSFPNPVAGWLSVTAIFGALGLVRLLIGGWKKKYKRNISLLADQLDATALMPATQTPSSAAIIEPATRAKTNADQNAVPIQSGLGDLDISDDPSADSDQSSSSNRSRTKA